MIRRSFLIHARPGMAEEYIKRHNPIWPEMEAALRQHGVSNYSIFWHEPTNALFGYLEIADEMTFARIAGSQVCQRWWAYMKEVLITEDDDSPMAKEELLEEIFHLDGEKII